MIDFIRPVWLAFASGVLCGALVMFWILCVIVLICGSERLSDEESAAWRRMEDK